LTETDLPVCAGCGVAHPAEEMELTFKRPDAIAAMTEEARAARCRETDDQCALWGEAGRAHRFFVRALLPLTVADRDEPYCLGIWLEVSDAAFYRIDALWNDPGQTAEPPMAATLANSVPFHPESLGLHGRLQLTGPDSRPTFALADNAHGLCIEQQAGISAHRAWEYTRLVA
jgi:hypothetical protein